MCRGKLRARIGVWVAKPNTIEYIGVNCFGQNLRLSSKATQGVPVTSSPPPSAGDLAKADAESDKATGTMRLVAL